MQKPSELWFVVTDKSNLFKVARCQALVAILFLILGYSLPQDLRFFTGTVSALLLTYILYSQGVADGSTNMFYYLSSKAREAVSAMDMMDDILRKKNNE